MMHAISFRIGRLFAFSTAVVSAWMLTASTPLHAQSGDAGFDSYVQSLWPKAQARGVSRATFDRVTAGLRYNARVVALDRDDLTSLLGSNNFIRFFSAPDPTVSAFGTGAFPIDAASLRTGIVVPAFSKYVSIENVGGGSGGAEVQLNFQLDL